MDYSLSDLSIAGLLLQLWGPTNIPAKSRHPSMRPASMTAGQDETRFLSMTG